LADSPIQVFLASFCGENPRSAGAGSINALSDVLRNAGSEWKSYQLFTSPWSSFLFHSIASVEMVWVSLAEPGRQQDQVLNGRCRDTLKRVSIYEEIFDREE